MVILFSCEKTDRKSDFIGIWESFEKHHDMTALTFYQDSLVLDAFSGEFHTVSQWSVDKFKLYLKEVTQINPWTKLDTVISQSIIYNYKFNATKDTLKIIIPSDNPDDYSIYKRVDKNPFH